MVQITSWTCWAYQIGIHAEPLDCILVYTEPLILVKNYDRGCDDK